LFSYSTFYVAARAVFSPISVRRSNAYRDPSRGRFVGQSGHWAGLLPLVGLSSAIHFDARGPCGGSEFRHRFDPSPEAGSISHSTFDPMSYSKLTHEERRGRAELQPCGSEKKYW